MRAEFKCLAFSYVDDYFFLCDKDQAALCYQIFIRLNEILGFEVKREKSLEPSAEGKLLGILVRIDDDSITLDICPERAKRLTKTIDDHLQSASITPTQASKLAGRLSFAATSFHSRCGRAFLRALYHRANDTNYGHRGNNNDEALAALRWFRWAIRACPRKIVYLHTNTPHVILYTDAEFSYTGDPPQPQKAAALERFWRSPTTSACSASPGHSPRTSSTLWSNGRPTSIHWRSWR
ncbi:hypothetical protein FOZ62_017556, partial [Perkinsus olseni]